MQINGEMVIGQRTLRGTAGVVRAIDPSRNDSMGPDFGLATDADVDAACALAQSAFDAYRNTTLEQRAVFLETIAEGILKLGPTLIAWWSTSRAASSRACSSPATSCRPNRPSWSSMA